MKRRINIKEKNIEKIKVKKRTNENYTHIVNIDSKIVSVTTWRKSKMKFRLYLILNFLTLGLLHIISLFIPKLYLKIYCNQSLPTNSDFFLIEDVYNNFTLCKTIYKKSSNTKMSNNNDHNNDKNNDNITILFEYKSTKYKFDINTNSICPVYFNLSLYSNKTIIDSFMDGINTPEKYNRSIDTYGKNILNMNIMLIFQNLIRKDLPNCAVVCFSGGLCLYCKFVEFGGLLYLLAVSILIIKLIFRYMKFVKKLGKDRSLDGLIEYKVKRKYLKEQKSKGYNKIKNIDLVPGDILSLTEGEIIPCDCILLDGECILSESKLVGKVDTTIKSPLKSDNEYFNYKKNKYCVLFHGMEIVKVYSKNSSKSIISLVINTGVNTFKANELSNLLYENTLKEKNQEIYTFFVGKYYLIFIVFLSSISIVDIIVSSSRRKQDMSLADNIFIVLCFAFMPIYYLTSCYITFLGIFNLNTDDKQNIQCIDESRLIESGKINRVIFDKTGTLTENKIEISAFIPLYYDNSSYKFIFKIYEKNNIKKICEEHLIYYKNLVRKNSSNENISLIQALNEAENTISNKNSINYNFELSALFLQCLVCCSNLLKINNEICGNIIEKEVIDMMKWDINTVEIINEDNEDTNNSQENSESIIDKIHRIGSIFFNNANNISSNSLNNNSKNIISEVFPKNYYKITEGLKIKKKPTNIRNSIIRQSIRMNKNKINTFKLIIISRFFSNSYMNISCIVYNFIEDNYRFMIKGAPEKILKCCINTSFPEIEKLLIKALKEGYRVVACATKIIEYNQDEQNQKEEYYLKDLTLCGFIFLKNKLKDESKKVIEKIINMECDVSISTGDSISNVIGVGLESGIIKEKNIYVFDLNFKGKKPKIVVSNYFNDISKEKEYDKDKKTIESSKKIKSSKKKEDISNRNLTDKSKSKKAINELIDNTKSSEINKKQNLLKRKNSINNPSFYNDEQQHSYIPLSTNTINNEFTNNLNQNRKSFNSFYNEEQEVNNSPISYFFNEEPNFNTNQNIYNNNFRLRRKSSFINFDSNRKSIKNILNEVSKEQYKYVTPSKKEPTPNDGFHLDSTPPDKKALNVLPSRNKNNKSEDTMLLNNKSIFSSNKHNNIYSSINQKKSKITLYSNNSYINYSNQGSYKKFCFDYNLNKIKYFQKECTLCFSGICLRYIYDKRTEPEIKVLLKCIKEFGKIFFSMSPFEKSLLVKINRELFNKKVCMVGDGTNDIDAIMSSNVGIFIGEQVNLNMLLSHYIIKENNLMDIVTIIKNGRGYYENDTLLLPVNAVFTVIWISLIIYSSYYNSTVDNLRLSLLSITVLLLSIIGFTIKPDYNVNFNYLASNEKLIKRFNFLQFFGMFVFKVSFQMGVIYTYSENPNLDVDTKNKVIMSYIFILVWSQSMSTCFVFNVNTFYRKSILTNFPFLLIYTLTSGYIIYLLTLNDIAMGNINSIFLTFEMDKENIDYLDDNHKLNILYVVLIDFVLSYAYIKILKLFFNKKASQMKIEKNNNLKNG